MFRYLITSALLCVTISSFSQTPPKNTQVTVKYFSLFPENASIQHDCSAAGTELKKQLSVFPAPSDWRYLVICDDSSWTPVMQRVGLRSHPDLIYGATFFETHTTILRASALLGKEPRVTAQHLVSHELAHIVLNTANEDKAEKQAKEWMNSNQVVIAQR